MQHSNSKGGSPGQAKKRLSKSERAAYEKRKAKFYRDLAAKEKRDRDKRLTKLMKQTAAKGIYTPKSNELTKYRRSRLGKIAKTYKELLDPTKYFFVPVPKNIRKKALSKAANFGVSIVRKDKENVPASKTGLFVEKKNYKRIKLTIDKKTGEIGLTKSGKTKFGPNKGLTYSEHLPLVDIDVMSKETQRIDDAASKFKLKDGEYLAFVVTENGASGYSRKVFHDKQALLDELLKYEMNLGARVQFYRHITVVKVATRQQWFLDHPAQNAGKRGRAARRANKNNPMNKHYK